MVKIIFLNINSDRRIKDIWINKYGYKERYQKFKEWLSKYEYDILILCEVDTNLWKLIKEDFPRSEFVMYNHTKNAFRYVIINNTTEYLEIERVLFTLNGEDLPYDHEYIIELTKFPVDKEL